MTTKKFIGLVLMFPMLCVIIMLGVEFVRYVITGLVEGVREDPSIIPVVVITTFFALGLGFYTWDNK